MTAEPWTSHTEARSRSDVDWSHHISTWVPSRYDPDGDDAYPLIVCFDAQWTYGTVVDTVRILGLSKELPHAIVVGVGWNTDEPREVVQIRARDLTVSQAEAPAITGVRVPAAELGGAEAFGQWFLDDLLPDLESRWRISERVFVGHSFSALFGLHLLFTRPGSFHRWLLASPSVWWDDQVMFDRLAALAVEEPSSPATVFMSSGELETDDFSPHQEFADAFRARRFPGIETEFRRFAGETHSSTVPVAIGQGLRWLFSPDRLIPDSVSAN
ncbi:MAG: alpha/beta hydrolase [Actinomycetia bacterium]|nr:alpha/beta hydrolase [Actinomycetes bacterium]